MTVFEADPVELRVLGCLIEKQRTTPDVYPLTLNSLRIACNQSTNRDPVVDYDEPTIRAALEKLSRRNWVRLATGASSRAIKYRHLFDEALELSPGEISLLAVLMLRGPQTPGELRARTTRLYEFGLFEELHGTLERLIERELIAKLPRRPGQKEERYMQLLGGDEQLPPAAAAEPAHEAPSDLERRVTELEERVAALERASEADQRQTASEDSEATTI